MELLKLQPMGVGQIVGKSLRLYLKNFWRFLAIAAVFHIPLMVLLTVHALYIWNDNTSPASNSSSVLGFVILRWIFQMGVLVCVQIVLRLSNCCVEGAIFTAVSRDHLGRSAGVWQAYGFIRSKFRVILTASVILSSASLLLNFSHSVIKATEVDFIVGLLVIVCLVLSTMLMLWFAVTPYCIVGEDRSAWQSIRRSKALVKGNIGRVLGLGVLLILIYVVIFGVTFLVVRPILRAITENSNMVRYLPGLFAGFICLPLSSLAGSFLYYDLRARKEHSEATAGEGSVGQSQTQSKKPRTSRLAIASVVLGLLGTVIAVCLPAAITGLILGIAALIAIQSRKGQLIGQLKGRGIALAGIGISCLVMYLYSIQVLPFFYIPPKLGPCEPGEVLRNTQLANLPSSATSVQAVGQIRGGKQYLVFQATAEDIEKFVAGSESLKNQEPMLFDSDNMYLPRKHRFNFRDKEKWKEYSRHEHFRRRRYWPDWYDPTIRLKGRKYDITTSEDNHRRGTVVINDETDTVYILVRW